VKLAMEYCPDAEWRAIFALARFGGLRRQETPNLGKIVNDILEKAGIPKWSKPFVSMRGSAETDLAEKFPIQFVTAWLGNSPKVAQKHYLRVLPEHFEQALKTSAFSGKNGGTEPSQESQEYWGFTAKKKLRKFVRSTRQKRVADK